MGLFEKIINEEKEFFKKSFERFLELNNGRYSEMYKIKDNGLLSKEERYDDKVIPYLILVIEEDIYHHDFYSLIQELETELIDFSFKIDEDKSRQWIKYTIERK